MARIRTIKPEFWKHEDLSALPEATHMLAAALLNYADDEGYFNANPGLVRSECTPLREPSVSVQDSLNSLCRIGYLELFDGVDGKRYGRIVKFDEHQRVNRPTQSKIKNLRISSESSLPTHTQISECSSPERNREQGTGNRERKGKESPRERVPPPAKPESVTDETWADWLALRKAKRAPVTATVIREAEREAAKAGLSLERFLTVWCSRGSQGLQADWLKPHERAGPPGKPSAADDFRHTTYTGTPLDELPPELR